MLGKFIKVGLLIGIFVWVTLVCANELATRNIIPKALLQKAKLDQVTWQNSLWQFNQLIGKAPKLDRQTANLSQIWQQAGPQLNTLKDRGLTVSETARKFIQTQLFSAQAPSQIGSKSASSSLTGPSPTQLPLEQRTIEYAKYIYCKETVKTYEQLNPSVTQN